MTNWNDQQVGGSHYRQHGNEFQHWDFVVAAGLGYFEGQVTRYVVRYRQPDGGEGEKDLRKAIHYIGKLHSVCSCYVGGRAGMYARTAKWVQKFVQAHELDLMEQAIIQLVAGWQTPEDLVSARSGIEDLLKHWLGNQPKSVPLTEENKHAERAEKTDFERYADAPKRQGDGFA